MPGREWVEGPHLLPISPVFDDQGRLLDRRTANPNAARSGLARLRSGLVRRERSHSRRTGAAGGWPNCQSASMRFRQTRRKGALLVDDLPSCADRPLHWASPSECWVRPSRTARVRISSRQRSVSKVGVRIERPPDCPRRRLARVSNPPRQQGTITPEPNQRHPQREVRRHNFPCGSAQCGATARGRHLIRRLVWRMLRSSERWSQARTWLVKSSFETG